MKWIFLGTQKEYHQDMLYELVQEFVKILTGSCFVQNPQTRKSAKNSSNNSVTNDRLFRIKFFLLESQ
jgi:hypothetical protein